MGVEPPNPLCQGSKRRLRVKGSQAKFIRPPDKGDTEGKSESFRKFWILSCSVATISTGGERGGAQ